MRMGIFSNSTVEFQGREGLRCRTMSAASHTTITPCTGFQRLRTKRKTDRLFMLKGLIRKVGNGPHLSG